MDKNTIIITQLMVSHDDDDDDDDDVDVNKNN
jgi:hypothetical protein